MFTSEPRFKPKFIFLHKLKVLFSLKFSADNFLCYYLNIRYGNSATSLPRNLQLTVSCYYGTEPDTVSGGVFRTFYGAFFDFRKAVNLVDWEPLWGLLRLRGIPDWILLLLPSSMSMVVLRVRHGRNNRGQRSASFFKHNFKHKFSNTFEAIFFKKFPLALLSTVFLTFAPF